MNDREKIQDACAVLLKAQKVGSFKNLSKKKIKLAKKEFFVCTQLGCGTHCQRVVVQVKA